MSDLLELQEKLQDTLAALQRARELLAKDPGDTEFSLVVQSLEERQKTLEKSFSNEAAAFGIDICKYRVIRHEKTYPVIAFANSLRTFQSCLTAFFDAMRNGPKHSARSSADVVQKTTLDVGYVYSGSLGVALTVANEASLFDSDLDAAMKSMLKSFTRHKLA